MTEIEIAHIINRVTGIVAAVFAAGLMIGYARVLDHHNRMVRSIAWSIAMLTATAIVECLRVVNTEVMMHHLIAILYNFSVLFAAIRGIQAQHAMIPDEDRSAWRWYWAPLYPPWKWVDNLDQFVIRVRRHLWRKADREDRRSEQKPIDFPDRRKR